MSRPTLKTKDSKTSYLSSERALLLLSLLTFLKTSPNSMTTSARFCVMKSSTVGATQSFCISPSSSIPLLLPFKVGIRLAQMVPIWVSPSSLVFLIPARSVQQKEHVRRTPGSLASSIPLHTLPSLSCKYSQHTECNILTATVLDGSQIL